MVRVRVKARIMASVSSHNPSTKGDEGYSEGGGIGHASIMASVSSHNPSHHGLTPSIALPKPQLPVVRRLLSQNVDSEP